MINCFQYPNIFRLSDGHYMVNEVTDAMISLMWNTMSWKQREEFEIVYGKERAFDKFSEEIKRAEHSAAFFCGQSLTCIMWSLWVDVNGIGRCRVLGCVCSDFAIRHTINFVKHSTEVRDAFMLMEPSEVEELFVFITEDFEQSKRWAVRICGLKEFGTATTKNGAFTVFKYSVNDDKGGAE